MGKTYVGKCVECGARLFYDDDEEKLVAKGKMPGCLCHYEWPEDREKEEGEKNGETDN